MNKDTYEPIKFDYEIEFGADENFALQMRSDICLIEVIHLDEERQLMIYSNRNYVMAYHAKENDERVRNVIYSNTKLERQGKEGNTIIFRLITE